MPSVGVIGAGVVGMSTAVNIQRLIPGVKITVMADKFGGETLSAGAGGMFLPTKNMDGVSGKILRYWNKKSFEHYADLALSHRSRQSGCLVAFGYYFTDKEEMSVDRENMLFCRDLTPQEIRRLGVPYKFRNSGGIISHRTVTDLEELTGVYDIVVNCAGVRSSSFTKDPDLIPSRGQLIRVHAPWIKHWATTDSPYTYIIPGADNVILGSIRVPGCSSTEIDPAATSDILRRCYELCPSLRGAKIDYEWAGVRPFRKCPRVEVENIKSGRTSIYVVHNYGHNSKGVAMSWGTAVHAAELVRDCLEGLETRAKL